MPRPAQPKTPTPTIPAGVAIYSTADAAAYLGIEVATLYYHRKKGRLQEDRTIGTDLYFTRATLDRFKATTPTRGRQPSGADPLKVRRFGKVANRWAAMAGDRAKGLTLAELAAKYGYGDITAVSRALSRARVATAKPAKTTKSTKPKP